jgi:hypothetical protein
MSETVPGHAELVWPDELMIRDTKLYDDMGGGGQRIYTTAGRGYETRKYIRADLSTPIAAHGAGVPEDRKAAEERIMQEYRWGNLTPLGVANHLRRAGFNMNYAVDKANALRPDEAAGQGEARHPLDEGTRFGRHPDGNAGLVGARLMASERLSSVADVRIPGGPTVSFATPRPEADAPDIVPVAMDPEDATPKPVTAIDIPDAIWEAADRAFCESALVADDAKCVEILARAIQAALAALRAELAAVKRERDDWIASVTHLRKETDAEVARLKDENKELVAGLEPFADFGEFMEAETVIAAFRRARSLTAAKGG